MIDKHIIEEIKSRTSIEQVISQYVTLNKRGKNLLGLCPFHGEKTPSFNVRPDKGYYKCFGCGASGDVFTFLEAQTGQSFIEVAKELAAACGVDMPHDTSRRQQNVSPKEKSGHALLARASRHYEGRLWAPEGRLALAYLQEKRRLPDDIIKKYELGYGASGSHQVAALELTPEDRALAVELGILTGDDNTNLKDLFMRRVVFPIRGVGRHVHAFGGRVFRDRDARLAKYINSPQSDIYQKSRTWYGLPEALPALKQGEPAFIVEGYFDVLAAAASGIQSAIASCGTAVTTEHLHRLKKRTARVVLCFDGDKAGRAATKKTAMRALCMGFQVHICSVSEGDPASLYEKEGGDALKKRLKSHQSVMAWRFEAEKARAERGGPDERIAGLKAMLPWLAALQDPIAQEAWMKDIATYFQTSVELVRTQVSSAGQAVVDRFMRARSADNRRQQQAEDPARKQKIVPVRRELNHEPPARAWSSFEMMLAKAVMLYPELAEQLVSDANDTTGIRLRNPEMIALVQLCMRSIGQQHSTGTSGLRTLLATLDVHPKSPLIEIVREFDVGQVWHAQDKIMDQAHASRIVQDACRAQYNYLLRRELADVTDTIVQMTIGESASEGADAAVFKKQADLIQLLHRARPEQQEVDALDAEENALPPVASQKQPETESISSQVAQFERESAIDNIWTSSASIIPSDTEDADPFDW